MNNMSINDNDATFFKVTIKDQLLSKLYDPPANILYKDMCKILKKNMDLFNITAKPDVSYYVYYRTKKYYHDYAGYNQNGPGYSTFYSSLMDIHPAIKTKLHELHLELDNLWIEKGIIANFLNNLLNYCHNINDILVLLPKHAHKYITYSSSSQIRLREPEINWFKNHHEKDFKLLNERLMTNLLLKG